MIRANDDGAVRLITLDRPASLNALTPTMRVDLHRLVSDTARNPGIRAVVVAGAGRGFCSGHDLSGQDGANDPITERWRDEPIWMSTEQAAWRAIEDAQICIFLRRMNKPTIAAIRGPVIGTGFMLATACDLRVASDTAILRVGFASTARCGEPGAAYLLSQLVGPARARELFLLDPKLTAAEALRIGLVTRVVPDDQLEAEVMAIAQQLAAGPAMAYAGIKRNLNAAETASLEESIYAEAVGNIATSFSQDGKEASQAFLQKRKPVFRGY